VESAGAILALFLVATVFAKFKEIAVGGNPTVLKKWTLFDGRVYPTL
jgi:hypothetical protein